MLIVLAGASMTGQYQVRNRQVLREVRANLRDLPEWEYRRTARRLASHGLVRLRSDGEIDEISLLEAGKAAAAQRLIGLKSPLPKASGKRRLLVSFDIPEQRRARRRLLREALRALGFRLVHESLYEHSVDCASEVRGVAAALGIEGNVELFRAESRPFRR